MLHGSRGAPVRPRSAQEQYDDLAHLWWEPRGRFAMLQWLAVARAAELPPPRRPRALLVDVACGGGLLAPHVPPGYRYLGVDLLPSAVAVARAHGVTAVLGDARALPLPDGCADVVVAGEVLEHVHDPAAVLAEACRILAPGGTLLLDTVADTRLARFVAITVGEHVPGGPPPRLHDHRMFVDRDALIRACAAGGVPVRLRGLRPSVPGYLAWLLRLRPRARLVPTPITAVLFSAVGVKERPGAPRR
jgi:2-polyprenyl-6-hydroxyphenyl methylase / 3-demethylubiquinone-9 3-methyltransferase